MLLLIFLAPRICQPRLITRHQMRWYSVCPSQTFRHHIRRYTFLVETFSFLPLGISTAWKSDLGCTSAELVYSTVLRVPGKFVTPSDKASIFDYASRFQTAFQGIKPCLQRSRYHTNASSVPISCSAHLFWIYFGHFIEQKKVP